MCGLFGGLGKLNSNRMIALGCMNEDRGTDSVGIAYLAGSEIKLAKVAQRPCIGLNVTLRKEVTEAAISGLFIGHTRAATQGQVTSENAHPFLMDGIAFAHNGIIINDDDFGKYAVDSQSLIHGIKAHDFSKYEGCIALIWIEGRALKAYRCGNPLFRGQHGGTTYLASEEEQLQGIGCTSIKKLKEGLIYTFTPGAPITTERVKKNKSYTYSTQATYYPQSMYQYTAPGFKVEAPKQWGGLIEAKDKESFSTWKDDRGKEKATTDYCDLCGQPDNLTNGYCTDCKMWMKENNCKDVPPMLGVIESY